MFGGRYLVAQPKKAACRLCDIPRTIEQVMDDIDRDRFMTPEEALEYGLVDDVLAPPRNRPSTIAA